MSTSPVWPSGRRPSFRFNQVPNSMQDSALTTKQSNLMLIDQSKRQQFQLRSGFRQLQKHLRSQWTIEANDDELSDSTFEKCRVFVIPGPRAKFYEQEFDALRKFVQSGGRLLVTLSEGGEVNAETNINFLLEEFGIACNNDAVIRTVFFKYFDPKEALVSNGVLNRAIAVAAGKNATKFGDFDKNDQALSFVYPFGATLAVNRSAIPILSTGSVCFPISRPVCAFHTAEQGGGRVAVLGSTHMFTDQYFDKEENAKVFDFVLKFLNDGLELNAIDAAAPDLIDPHSVPDHIRMGSRLKSCIQESEVEQNLPVDFTKLFDNSIKSLDLSMWPTTIRAYEKIGLKHEPLSLVIPAFEVPQPTLQPAVFPPCFRDLQPPQLELFDLDDAFSSADTRLAQLVNNCLESEVERFVKEAADLLDIPRSLPSDRRGAKDILEHVLMQLVEFKKVNSDFLDPHAYAPDDHTNMFDPPIDEDHYFSDIDEYDDL